MKKEELCKKIEEIYPEIGKCGINVDVEYKDEKRAWIVDLKKENHELITYLETDEAKQCLEGKQCESLKHQLEQLVRNIEMMEGVP